MSPEAERARTAPAPPPEAFAHTYVRAGDLRMHAVTEGNPDDPLIVLLHGFPEYWYSWRHQIGPLAAAGYYVVAPDMRGYNLTEKTPPYDMFTVAGDIAQLVAALGHKHATIVGHDWGGMIAWALAMMRPEVVERLIVCNLPHPRAVHRALTHLYLPQVKKSWYIFTFQLPALPEWSCRRNDYATLLAALRHDLRSMSDVDADRYRVAWSQPGAIHAMLGYYRALFPGLSVLLREGQPVSAPTMLVWGEPDLALDTRLAEWSRDYVPGLRLELIPDAGHFIQQMRPADVTRLMLDFLAQTRNATKQPSE